jgi:hypothetical protein
VDVFQFATASVRAALALHGIQQRSLTSAA